MPTGQAVVTCTQAAALVAPTALVVPKGQAWHASALVPSAQVPTGHWLQPLPSRPAEEQKQPHRVCHSSTVYHLHAKVCMQRMWRQGYCATGRAGV